MNKWIITGLIFSLVTINAQAKAAYCDYKDYFRLNDFNHPQVAILSGTSDSDILLQMIGPQSFVIRDSYQCRNGYAHITVVYSNDYTYWCLLNIKDGPFMSHPSVSASCQGMRYINTEYDGFNSYSYTINLD
jgi:hypothetical protein